MQRPLLDKYLVEVQLKPANEALSWLISRVGCRVNQERIIRHWNKHQRLPRRTALLPRVPPTHNPALWREAL